MALTSALAASGCAGAEHPTYQEAKAHRQAYAFTLELNNAPGPPPDATAHASHTIDLECLPIVNNLEGIQHTPKTAIVDPEVSQRSDCHYEGRFYLDAMAEIDYYGRGPCGWRLQFIDIRISAGGEEDTSFSTSISASEVASEGTLTRYFSRDIYPRDRDRSPQISSVDSGYPEDKRVDLPPPQRDHLFKSSLEVRKLTVLGSAALQTDLVDPT